MPSQSHRPYLPRVQGLVCLGIVYNILYLKKILPPIIQIPLLKASRANIQHVWKYIECGSSCLEWPAGTLLCWNIYRKHMPIRCISECCNSEVIFPRSDIEEQLNQCDSQEEVLPDWWKKSISSRKDHPLVVSSR